MNLDGVSLTRLAGWFAATVVALVLSSDQARFFDCNKLPALSVLGGLLTLLAVCGVAERLYRFAGSAASRKDRLSAAWRVLLFGGGLVACAGTFTFFTHLCP